MYICIYVQYAFLKVPFTENHTNIFCPLLVVSGDANSWFYVSRFCDICLLIFCCRHNTLEMRDFYSESTTAMWININRFVVTPKHVSMKTLKIPQEPGRKMLSDPLFPLQQQDSGRVARWYTQIFTAHTLLTQLQSLGLCSMQMFCHQLGLAENDRNIWCSAAF